MNKEKINYDFLVKTINVAIRNDSRISDSKYQVELLIKSTRPNANWEAYIQNAPIDCASVLNEICETLTEKYDVIWDDA